MRICRVMIISSAISSVVNSTTNRKKAVISEPVLILETEATVGSRSWMVHGWRPTSATIQPDTDAR